MKLRGLGWLLLACVSALFFTTGCTADDDGGGTVAVDGGKDASRGDGGGISAEAGNGSSFTVGGLLTGLTTGGTVVLQDNGGDDLTLTANGAFTFATPVASGATYAVTVLTQPTSPAQTCTISGGRGTVAGGSVGTVEVVCSTPSFTLGGTVSGLQGTGLALTDGAGDELAVTGNGMFVFGHPLTSGTAFTVSVKTQPTGPMQTCRVAGGSGTVASGNITSVSVNCNANTFSISGTVTGLLGSGLVLQNNGGDSLSVTSNSFAFATPVASGQTYNVTVLTQPTSPSQNCGVTGGSGPVAAADITSVVVSCAAPTFTVGGTITGLATGQSVVLQDNGGDNLTVSANGTFTFATKLATGGTYAVTTFTQPSSGSCHLFERTGTVASGPVTTVTATCGIDYYVNADATGSDANPGTSAASPWKTLTHAIAAVTAGGTINVAAGTYNAANGETFPLEPRANQTFLGDPANNGVAGASSTIISGSGFYQPGGELGAMYSLAPIIALKPGVGGVAFRGFDLLCVPDFEGDGTENIVIDGATLTLANDTVAGANVESITDLNGGNVTVLDSAVTDAVTLITDAATVFKARRTTFAGAASSTAVKVGFSSAVLTGSNVDLGTASDPGGNSILPAASGFGLHIVTATTGVRAAGNTWSPNVQGSSATGTYATQVVTGPVPQVPGNNYYLDTNGSIQL
jgi:hypothetical protein